MIEQCLITHGEGEGGWDRGWTMVAAFRVVISSCSLAMRDKCVVRWNGTSGKGEKVARGSGLAIVYTSSSFRAERDPRVTFVSGVPDAARCRLHRRPAARFRLPCLAFWLKVGFVANQSDSFLTLFLFPRPSRSFLPLSSCTTFILAFDRLRLF